MISNLEPRKLFHMILKRVEDSCESYSSKLTEHHNSHGVFSTRRLVAVAQFLAIIGKFSCEINENIIVLRYDSALS